MPSSAQCIQIATLAAYVGRLDFRRDFSAEEIAQNILKLHRHGQTLGDLYATEKTLSAPRLARIRSRIKSLEDSCRELADQLVKDLGVTVTVRFRHRGEVPQLRDLTKLVEKAADASVRPETLAIDITEPPVDASRRGGTKTFYLGGRQ